MIKQALILAALVALAMTEAPLSGPYPPSGWKPSGAPFTLPKEFLPNPQAGDADIQVSKENVQFAGQLVETTTVSNAYLPPDQAEEEDDDTTEDILKVQGLPSSERRPFNPRAQSGQLNQGEYSAPSGAETGQYRDQDTQKFGQLRQQNQQQQYVQNRQQSRQQFGNNQAEQFGQLNAEPQQPQQFNPQPRKFRPQPRQFKPQPQQFNQQPQQFNPQPQQFNQQPQQFNPQQPQQFNQQPQQFNPQPQQFNQQPQQFNQQPQQFSPQPQQFNQQPQQFSPQPQQFNQQPQVFSPVPQQPQLFNVQQPQFNRQPQPQGVPATKYGPPTPNPKSDAEDDDDTTDSGEDSGDGTQPNVAVANSVSKGQYYILTPDNTLQRVAFTATQDQDEVRTNGFTAQLRYMPVEPIRDPIYAFNEEGQLIRIFKK